MLKLKVKRKIKKWKTRHYVQQSKGRSSSLDGLIKGMLLQRKITNVTIKRFHVLSQLRSLMSLLFVCGSACDDLIRSSVNLNELNSIFAWLWMSANAINHKYLGFINVDQIKLLQFHGVDEIFFRIFIHFTQYHKMQCVNHDLMIFLLMPFNILYSICTAVFFNTRPMWRSIFACCRFVPLNQVFEYYKSILFDFIPMRSYNVCVCV